MDAIEATRETTVEEREEREEQVMNVVLYTIDSLGYFVGDVCRDQRHATPESIIALPEVADAICHLVNVAYENNWLES